MAAFTQPTPPLPREIQAQMAPPQEPMLMRMGQSQSMGVPSPQELLGELQSLIGQLEQTTGAIGQLLDVIHRPTKALLVPIAQAGIAIKNSVAAIAERVGASAGPAPGPPAMPSTPAEAQPGRMMG